MKFLDLFAGIGGFRLGMERAGHKCVGYVEIDKFARKSYQAIHDTEGEWTREDITKVTDEEWRELRGTVDVICGGFPCQAFSIAGKRLGFEETRGTLFFEIARAAKQIQPRYLFLENVKGLLSHNKGETFATILTALDELGYDAEWQILNSKDFGVPQNRERVFIIGNLRGTGGREIFPLGGENRTFNKNDIGGGREPKIAIPVLTPGREEKRQNGRRFKDAGEEMFTLTVQDVHGVLIPICEATKRGYALAKPFDSVNLAMPNSNIRRGRVGDQIANTLDTSCNQGVVVRVGNVNPSGQGMNGKVYSDKGISPTLTTNKGEGLKVAIIQKSRGFNHGGKHDIAPTLSSSSWQENNLLQEGNFRIRKLTPRECWRLQGFPDWAFDRAAEVNSNSQLYKQAGNSVTVNVIENIAKLFKEEQA
ncbi:DNA cytosine methyltransferase [Listeria monocytogenes]|uniref:DNA cytosine methyltransferase n=1 Tax=Listeria monocytogenes TaxID=1639 RepID=UPI000D1ED00B|nr:DNA (cytosine-5-)-methyltransferase [Listeria monocytogenes]AVU87786.1 DNA (cytosine-5-)-methyltransferase [Listeria monocytogenes]EAC4387004.1 DNA (cytosine-5-)-methyltransferase [Listeria monocytogenes]EAD1153114.1 DNA (cytosine-5-)-methyltransferase [Listeria monocytogenes]EAD4967633.1 DNA (cytosine-5-)-methyltransferase [Listeria monocytogenes]ECP4351192.1 DNA (cytosine-5-)-methyltransferase [Listeria monocytogenes]